MSRGVRLSELADRLGAEVVGDGEFVVRAVRALGDAGAEDLSFLHNPKYVEDARSSRAGAILIADADALPGRNVLVCSEPYLALAKALELFYPAERPAAGIHPSAVVAEDVVVGPEASIGPLCVVASGARIGRDTIIGAGCVLGRGVEIGAECLIHPKVVIEDGCRLGDRCTIQSGTVVGADGFGFATVDGVHHKVPQVGIVVLEDDVELGANVCVDLAALGETRIGRGTKVDNLVQIAHNVQIGEHCLLVALVGISGSTEIGHHTVFAGQAGCAGHLKIGSGVVAAARAAVFKDVPDGVTVAGVPARPHREWLKANAGLQRLDGLREKVKRLEARIDELEGATS
ncbi:MAG: UDP-3-O-(3-hydroxymyristoyl)glucosamine N-acyltransferase [Acidobacteriota bacterium]|nr:UDP-3-O-(3-hydroxymyristoyl)glucosamine N-acyltransferase [Acidobacteriota bacterium]